MRAKKKIYTFECSECGEEFFSETPVCKYKCDFCGKVDKYSEITEERDDSIMPKVYTKKCTECGDEFVTNNQKEIVCHDCDPGSYEYECQICGEDEGSGVYALNVCEDCYENHNNDRAKRKKSKKAFSGYLKSPKFERKEMEQKEVSIPGIITEPRFDKEYYQTGTAIEFENQIEGFEKTNGLISVVNNSELIIYWMSEDSPFESFTIKIQDVISGNVKLRKLS